MHLYFLRGNILNLSETLHIFLHFRVGEKTEVFTVCAHDKKRTGNDIAVQAAVAVHAVQLCFVIADKERIGLRCNRADHSRKSSPAGHTVK